MLLLFFACSDVDNPVDDQDHDQELITTVSLELTPPGGEVVEAKFVDFQDGSAVSIDEIRLLTNLEYSLQVLVLNDLEEPIEDITAEILDEAEEHQFFFTGSIEGCSDQALVQHSYIDQDSNGLPIGVESSLVTLSTGQGELRVSLRHMPPEDGQTVKVSGLEDELCAGNETSIPGDWDVRVTFPLFVE